MKISNNFKKLSAVFLIAILMGCSSQFIDRPPLDAVVADNYFTNQADMLSSTTVLYNYAWFGYNSSASWGIGDAKGGVLYNQYFNPAFFQYRLDPNDGTVADCWRSFFNVIANANLTAYNINKFTKAAVAESDKNTALGECKFMRGTAYFYLICNWGKGVPLIENNINNLYVKDIRINTPESVYEFVIRDLTFAKAYLPATPSAPGRVSSYAAKGMLAKVYMFRAALKKGKGLDYSSDIDSARANAADVCLNSGLTLMPNYEDLFKTQYNSSKGQNTEYLFAQQWVYNGGYGVGNGLQANFAFSSCLTGFSDGWGGGIGASASILKYYLGHPEDSIRRKGTFFFPGETYKYLTYCNPDPNDPTKTIDGPLVVPVGNTGKANIKKYVVGRPSDNGGEVLQQNTSINTYMLRLAEVYLIYAETFLDLDFSTSTSDAEALKYFNLVRTRAKIAPKSSLTYKDVYDEKRIELAMEGSNFYELVKIHYLDKQRCYDMIDTTQMADYYINLVPNSNPKKWTLSYPAWETNETEYPQTIHVDDNYFYLPLPAVEISKKPALGLPAVDYDFSKYE